MAIDENVLFKTLFEKRSDQSIEEIMRDVAKAKAAYAQAEEDFAFKAAEGAKEAEADDNASAKNKFELKRLTKRHLILDPATAIGDTSISCCLCGKDFKTLSSAHLRKHGTTPAIYRKLCGYPENQILMSHARAEQMMETVKIAQDRRRSLKKATANQE